MNDDDNAMHERG